MSEFKFFSPRVEKLSFGYLITNNYGNFVILNEDEYTRFVSDKVAGDLFKKLEAHDIIITNANKNRVINRYKDSKRQILQGTSLHIIIPTARCNKNCIYCHAPTVPANRSGFDMTIEIADKTLEFIFHSPAKEITIEFQGGEPLLNFDVVEHIVEKAKKIAENIGKDVRFTLVSNLSVLDKEKLDFLIKENVGICTSLDGPRELQEKNRAFTYHDIEKWAPIIQEETHKKLSGICIVTRESLKYPKEIVKTYLNYEFNRLWIQPFHALGKGKKNYNLLKYDAEDYILFWKTVLDYIVMNHLNIQEVSTTFLLKKLILKQNPLFVDLQSPCGAIINQMAYDYDGSIYSCDEARMLDSDTFKLGNVNQKYSEIVKSPLACSIIGFSINDTLICDKCVFKPYCGVCPVIAFAENHSPVPKPDNFDCKVLKAQFKHLLELYFTKPDYKKVFDKWIQTKDL